MSDLVRRVAAVQATKAQFAGHPFSWGEYDCVTLAHWHLSNLGYVLPELPRYRTANGAVVALKKQGFASLTALLDSLIEPIPHAMALPADIMVLRGEPPLEGIAICAGRKLIGYSEGEESLVNLVPLDIERAWRAEGP
jgi:hypothetical protein